MKRFVWLVVMMLIFQGGPAWSSGRSVSSGPPRLAQGLEMLGAVEVRSRFDGSGISIAVIDSGIDPTHSMLGASASCGPDGFTNDKVIGGWDPGENDDLPCDSARHGTNVAGIAGGLAPDSPSGPGGDYVGGVAPGAKIYALKITKANGRPGSNAYLAALRWIADHWNDDPDNPIRVVTNSNTWGKVSTSCHDSGKRYERKVEAVLGRLKQLGILVFNSAGNAGFKDAIQWPGCMHNVQSVGALHDVKGHVLKSSNSGDLLDFFAPASPVITTAPGGGFGKFGTTSAAAAYAAGAAAVIQQAATELKGKPLSVDELLVLMRGSGKMVADPRTATGLERPRIDVGEAIRQLGD